MLGQCKEDGRCECRPGFVGTRCDMCEENFFYNRSAPGCQQCPSCYSLVRDKVRTWILSLEPSVQLPR